MPVDVSLMPVKRPTAKNAARFGEKAGAPSAARAVKIVAEPITKLRVCADNATSTAAPARAPNARPSVIQLPPLQSRAWRSRQAVNRFSGSIKTSSDTGKSSGLKKARTGATTRAKPMPIAPGCKPRSRRWQPETALVCHSMANPRWRHCCTCVKAASCLVALPLSDE